MCSVEETPIEKEVNTKHMVVSWEIPAQITKSLLCAVIHLTSAR